MVTKKGKKKNWKWGIIHGARDFFSKNFLSLIVEEMHRSAFLERVLASFTMEF